MEFESYDSLDAMYKAMEEQRMLADSFVKPFQKAASPGDYYTQATDYGFTIYGEILQDPEPRPPKLVNYRFVEAYSVACPDGERGDIHVSSIDRIITADEFFVGKGQRMGGLSTFRTYSDSIATTYRYVLGILKA
jgi:hypothetical protein